MGAEIDCVDILFMVVRAPALLSSSDLENFDTAIHASDANPQIVVRNL